MSCEFSHVWRISNSFVVCKHVLQSRIAVRETSTCQAVYNVYLVVNYSYTRIAVREISTCQAVCNVYLVVNYSYRPLPGVGNRL